MFYSAYSSLRFRSQFSKVDMYRVLKSIRQATRLPFLSNSTTVAFDMDVSCSSSFGACLLLMNGCLIGFNAKQTLGPCDLQLASGEAAESTPEAVEDMVSDDWFTIDEDENIVIPETQGV